MMERVVILGGGESGCGSAILAKTQGKDVFLSDKGTIAPEYTALLDQWKIPYESGCHTEDLILNADLIVKSPGIPDIVPIVQSLREKGVPVISEIEFAGRYTDAKTICITGSNGKTTTTTLIYEMLRQGSLNVGLAGNIGDSFALSVATKQYDWYVLELSSFQLDGMFEFKADIGLLLNITPDHLDRYDYEMRGYVDSKFRMIRNQGPDDRFIYGADDPVIRENIDRFGLPMQVLPFGWEPAPGRAAFTLDTMLHAEVLDTRLDVDFTQLSIQGKHNVYNAMAASLAALAAGVRPESIRQTLLTFTGVEHRMEPVGEFDGVQYINDSKATNVDAVHYALESMTRPVIWIAGGTDKGNDYAELDELAARHVKALVCLGADNQKLISHFTGKVPIIADANTLQDAMRAVQQMAQNGDTVLLSPACASFDLFRNYEDRGTQFKSAVLAMVNTENKL